MSAKKKGKYLASKKWCGVITDEEQANRQGK